MKAITIPKGGGLGRLEVVEKKAPKPKANEVLVQWHATSLNYHDYLVAIGAIPVGEGRVPMSDGAGEILSVGEGVTRWKKGDKVMSLFFPYWVEGGPTFEKLIVVSGETVNGYMTEMSCISEQALTAIPEGYSYAEAATLPCAALTAYNGLMHTGTGLRAGQSVLVEGTGGMSMFALQMAVAAGAQVYATTSSEEKKQRLLDMGVKAVVNYREEEKWGKEIFKLSGGGVDYVLDVGGGSTMHQSIEAAKIGGHIVSIGILGNGRKGSVTFPKLFFKFITMRGIAVGSRQMQEEMIQMINTTGIKPLIDKTFAFDELADAFRYQESGQHFGKIVLEW